jgi:hypothetical protein
MDTDELQEAGADRLSAKADYDTFGAAAAEAVMEEAERVDAAKPGALSATALAVVVVCYLPYQHVTSVVGVPWSTALHHGPSHASRRALRSGVCFKDKSRVCFPSQVPVADGVGTRLLRKMGWRVGKGIARLRADGTDVTGAKKKRRARSEEGPTVASVDPELISLLVSPWDEFREAEH